MRGVTNWPRMAAPVLLLALATVSPAKAALGRSFSSVDADRVAFRAAMSSQTNAAFAVHVLNLPNSGTVKEYTRPDGVVFAVTWRGPGRPDLRQLLGDSFEAVQADSALANRRRMRQPLSSARPNLLVQSGGHSGAFWGLAINPQLQPSGFSAGDLN